MAPRTGRGWVQLATGILLVLLATLAAVDVQRSAAIATIGVLGVAALMYSGSDRQKSRDFSDFLARHHVGAPPAVVFLAIFFGVAIVWLVLGLLAAK